MLEMKAIARAHLVNAQFEYSELPIYLCFSLYQNSGPSNHSFVCLISGNLGVALPLRSRLIVPKLER